ncbi:hypothetical protein evm_002003 [Chilo suppressalis]|nr:hypothetical protein evm_002003 [Chilo suppressalis]
MPAVAHPTDARKLRRRRAVTVRSARRERIFTCALRIASVFVKIIGGKTRQLPINVPTAGAQAFPMDGIGRLDHDPPRGPSSDWWVLTTADAAGTNGFRSTEEL